MFEKSSETMSEIAQAVFATIVVGALLAIGLASIHRPAPDQAFHSPLKEQIQLSEPAS